MTDMAATGSPEVAGIAVLSLEHFIESRQGSGAFRAAVATLPLDEQRIFSSVLTPLRRYPTRSFVAVIHAGARREPGRDFFRAYGRAAAEFELRTIHRLLLRFSSPEWLLERGAKLWSNYHDTGSWTIHGSRGSLVGSLRDFAIVDQGYCEVLAGWFLRCAELTGARNAEVQHSACRTNGAPSCDFLLTY